MMASCPKSEPRRCPICTGAELVSRQVEEEFQFATEQGFVRVVARGVPVDECPACGERFSGPDAARVRHEAICRTLGLLAPQEIRAIRERLGVSQAEFSRLTAIGEATISRWERGRLLQNRANDRFLRIIAELPDSVAFLSNLAAKAPPHGRTAIPYATD